MAVLLCHPVPGLLLHSTGYNSILIKKKNFIKSGIFAQVRDYTERERRGGRNFGGATCVIVPNHSQH